MHEVERAPVAVQYLARLKPGPSRQNSAVRLQNICRILGVDSPADFPWHQLSVVEIGVLRGELERKYAPNNANAHLQALRGVLRAAWREGLLTADQYERLLDFRPVPGGAVRPGRCLTLGEVQRLMAVSYATPGDLGKRNRAMLAVLIEGGLRRSEVSRLQLKDYVRGCLHVVRSKHGRTRVVPLERARRHLSTWLRARGLGDGPLFPVLGSGLGVGAGVSKVESAGGAGLPVRVRPISPDMVDQIIKSYLRAAGLGDVTLHDLRRTMISHLLARGNDLAVAARLAGHADPRTTATYDKRPQEAAEAAMRTLEMPL